MFWTVLLTCVLHQLAECQVISDFRLNLSVQHVSLRTAQPLAAFLSCDCGSVCYTADLAEASPRQGSWPRCLTSPFRWLPLPSGEEGEDGISCRCDEETSHHVGEALLSFSARLPLLFYKSAWQACERVRPGKKTPTRILQWTVRRITVEEVQHHLKTWQAVLNPHSRVKQSLVMGGPSRNATTWVCLCEALE